MSFVVLDANWDATVELFRAFSRHLPGILVDARDLVQAGRQGWRGIRWTRLEQVAPRLWRLQAVFPPGWFHRASRFAMPVLARAIARAGRAALGREPDLWFVTSPYYRRLVDRRSPRWCVYRVMDDYRHYWPHRAAVTQREEGLLIARSDLVVTVSRYHRNVLRSRYPRHAARIVHLPNGVPDHFFDPPDAATRVRAERLVAGMRRPLFLYAGDPRGRVHAEMVRRLVATGRGTVFVAGPEQETVELQDGIRLPSLGRLEPRLLAALYRVVDVLLIPQASTEFNRCGSPRKLWEYCASGTPVVAAGVPDLEPDRCGVRVAETPEAFVEAVLRLAEGADRPPDRQRRVELARSHRYEELASVLARRLAAIGVPEFGGQG